MSTLGFAFSYIYDRINYEAGKNSRKRLASACRRGKVLDWEKVCGYRCWEASPFITAGKR